MATADRPTSRAYASSSARGKSLQREDRRSARPQAHRSVAAFRFRLEPDPAEILQQIVRAVEPHDMALIRPAIVRSVASKTGDIARERPAAPVFDSFREHSPILSGGPDPPRSRTRNLARL